MGSSTYSSPCRSSSPRASLEEEVSDHTGASGTNGCTPYPRSQISLRAEIAVVLVLWKTRHDVSVRAAQSLAPELVMHWSREVNSLLDSNKG